MTLQWFESSVVPSLWEGIRTNERQASPQDEIITKSNPDITARGPFLRRH